MSPTTPQDVPPSAQLLHMIFDSFILSRAISVAAKLGIADLLKADAKTADELAQATRVYTPSLYRVLRALASVGIFAEDETGRFHLTPLAEPLRSDASDSWRAFANFLGSDWAYRAYGDILHSVQTGQPAFDHVYGKPLFEYLAENSDQARIFNDAMTNSSQSSAPAILSVYDFSGITKLIDVGGGHGFLLASILKAYPQMQGVLFDLPSVVEGAEPVLEAQGVSDRCECIGGDFFTSVPSGGDAYIMQAILHGMTNEQVLQLLHTIHQSMRENGTLVQVDAVVPEGNEPSTSKFGNLHMMIFTPSYERSEAEYRALYERAGFKLTRVLPTASVFSILEGKPI
jgi:O-methyltransferase/methyltransferase family protein